MFLMADNSNTDNKLTGKYQTKMYSYLRNASRWCRSSSTLSYLFPENSPPNVFRTMECLRKPTKEPFKFVPRAVI